jgi:hypothetical protein
LTHGRHRFMPWMREHMVAAVTAAMNLSLHPW